MEKWTESGSTSWSGQIGRKQDERVEWKQIHDGKLWICQIAGKGRTNIIWYSYYILQSILKQKNQYVIQKL